MSGSASRIYVGGLDRETRDRDLEDVFYKFGKISNIWIARNPPGFAFIVSLNKAWFLWIVVMYDFELNLAWCRTLKMCGMRKMPCVIWTVVTFVARGGLLESYLLLKVGSFVRTPCCPVSG